MGFFSGEVIYFACCLFSYITKHIMLMQNKGGLCCKLML